MFSVSASVPDASTVPPVLSRLAAITFNAPPDCSKPPAVFSTAPMEVRLSASFWLTIRPLPLLATDAAPIVTSPVPPRVPVLLSAPLKLTVVALLEGSALISWPLLLSVAAVNVVTPCASSEPVLVRDWPAALTFNLPPDCIVPLLVTAPVLVSTRPCAPTRLPLLARPALAIVSTPPLAQLPIFVNSPAVLKSRFPALCKAPLPVSAPTFKTSAPLLPIRPPWPLVSVPVRFRLSGALPKALIAPPVLSRSVAVTVRACPACSKPPVVLLIEPLLPRFSAPF